MCVCEKTLRDSRVCVCVKEKVSALLDSSVCVRVCVCEETCWTAGFVCVCEETCWTAECVCV